MVRDTGAPVSLADAAKNNTPAKFSDNRRKKKEVDLADLRKTLTEVLETVPPKPAEKEKPAERPEEGPSLEIKPMENKFSAPDVQQNEEGEVIKPGETVEL